MRRCSSFLTVAASAQAESLSAPKWASMMQFHVSSGATVALRFAKDLGTVTPPAGPNPADWGSQVVVGPGVSGFIVLPTTGQLVLVNTTPVIANVLLTYFDGLGA